MAVGAHAGISPNSIPLSFVADSCGLPFMHTAPHYFFLSSLRHRPLMIVFFVNDLPTNRKGFVPAIFALVRSLLFTLARPSLLSLLMFSSYSLPSLLPPPLLLPLHRAPFRRRDAPDFCSCTHPFVVPVEGPTGSSSPEPHSNERQWDRSTDPATKATVGGEERPVPPPWPAFPGEPGPPSPPSTIDRSPHPAV